MAKLTLKLHEQVHVWMNIFRMGLVVVLKFSLHIPLHLTRQSFPGASVVTHSIELWLGRTRVKCLESGVTVVSLFIRIWVGATHTEASYVQCTLCDATVFWSACIRYFAKLVMSARD